MTTKCRCGGTLRRTDIRPILVEGRVLYADIDPLKANWACDRCRAVRTQRKRQAVKPIVVLMSKDTDDSFDFLIDSLSDGGKGRRRLGEIRRIITEAVDVPDAVRRLEATGFDVRRT